MPKLLMRKQIEEIAKCETMKNCEDCPHLGKQSCADICSLNPAQTALALLDILERIDENCPDVCPICGNKYFGEHADDCEFGNLLKEVRG